MNASGRRPGARRNRTGAAAITAAAVLVAASAAGASTGGGSYATPTPAVRAVQCLTDCHAAATARPGSTIQLAGRHLNDVAVVFFLGGKGRADDVQAHAASPKARAVDVQVPDSAKSGPVEVVDSVGHASRPSRAELAVDPSPVPAPAAGTPVSASGDAHVFPVQGPHNYGGSEARFGAARSGHTHEGQDVMAKCGTPLVAAQAGKVVWKDVQSAAGNYLVLHGVDGYDNAYMHLREPGLVSKGAEVQAGQPIGYVGDTGDATACHLHFEVWTAPGWYNGGKPIDPLPFLKAWDK